ncbi:ferredoxin [Spirillospora sp. NPDC029432]|uniref:ferredoxin n=1 Tax=Spirillospora sp. NPDC029432 TaxID=3154599 RepID=UPI0034541863
MRIKLDRTLCDGFGMCGVYDPETFSIDEWGYASLAAGAGEVPADREADVRRALLDCPVHAITELSRGHARENRGTEGNR